MKIEFPPLGLIVNDCAAITSRKEHACMPETVEGDANSKYAPSDLRSQALACKDTTTKHEGLFEKDMVRGVLDGLSFLSDETSTPHPSENVPNLESKLSSFSPSLASELSSLSSHSSASKCSHSSKIKEVTMTDTELLRHVQRVARSKGLITTYAVKFDVETSGTISTTNIVVETKMKSRPMGRINKFISRAA